MNKIINILKRMSVFLNNIAEFLQNKTIIDEYYVYVPTRNKPKYIHTTYKSAKKEAERIQSDLCYGEKVEILQIIKKNYYNER